MYTLIPDHCHLMSVDFASDKAIRKIRSSSRQSYEQSLARYWDGPLGQVLLNTLTISKGARLIGNGYSLRSRKNARTYPSASVTSKPHSPSSMNDNSFTNDAPRRLNSSKSASGSML
jgi:hypothetical protein